MNYLRYFAAHSCILTLFTILIVVSIGLWESGKQTTLLLNKTRSPAPFSDTEILHLLIDPSSTSSGSSTSGNGNNNNNNNNGGGSSSSSQPQSEDKGIVATTEAMRTLFSNDQLTQSFGVPQLVTIWPSEYFVNKMNEEANELFHKNITNVTLITDFFSDYNVSVWWQTMVDCMSRVSNGRTIVRSAFGGFAQAQLIEYFPKLTAFNNSAANAFIWLRDSSDGGTSNSGSGSTSVQEEAEGSSSSLRIGNDDYSNRDEDNIKIRKQIVDICLKPSLSPSSLLNYSSSSASSTTNPPEIGKLEVFDIHEALFKTRTSVGFHWPASILIATFIAIFFVSIAATNTYTECEVKTTLVSLLRTTSTGNNTSDSANNNQNVSSNNNNNHNNVRSSFGGNLFLTGIWSDDLLLDVACRRSSAKSALQSLQNRWNAPITAAGVINNNNISSSQHYDLPSFDDSQQVATNNILQQETAAALLLQQQNNNNQAQNLSGMSSMSTQPPPSLQPTTGRKIVIFLTIFLWLLVVSMAVPFLMLIGSMKLVSAIKGASEYETESASPYFGPIALFVVFLPFSIIHLIHCLKVVDSLFVRDLHAEFCAFLKQESVWARFWFGPKGYWLSATLPIPLDNNNNKRNATTDEQQLVESTRASVFGNNNNNSGNSGGRNNNNNNNDQQDPYQYYYQRGRQHSTGQSSTLTSSSYNNMYSGSVYNPVSTYQTNNDSFAETDNQQQQQQRDSFPSPTAPPNSRLSNQAIGAKKNNSSNSSNNNSKQQRKNNNNNRRASANSNDIPSSEEEDEEDSDDDDDDSLSCTDRLILIFSSIIGSILLPIILNLRMIRHCPVKYGEKTSRRFLAPILVAAFLTMCTVGSVLLAEATFALVGACVLACAAFMLVTIGVVLPICSAAFLGSLMITANWYRSALIDPVCEVEDEEVEEVMNIFFSGGSNSSTLDSPHQQQRNRSFQQQSAIMPPSSASAAVVGGIGTLHQQRVPISHTSREPKFEHFSTIHAAYVAFKKELQDYEIERKRREHLLKKQGPNNNNDSAFISSSVQDLPEQTEENGGEYLEEAIQRNNNRNRTTQARMKKKNKCCNNIFARCYKKLSSSAASCSKLVVNLSHNKGSRRKLMTLRWVILGVFVVVPIILAAIMFTQVHFDSCGWEHFLPSDVKQLRSELLTDNRTAALLPYTTVFDFCAPGSVSTSTFFSTVSATHYGVSQKLGYGNSQVNYFLWDVTRNNAVDQTYNEADAIFLDFVSIAYRTLSGVLINTAKSAQIAITVPDFDPFGSVLGGKHDSFVEAVRNALFEPGAGGSPMPTNPPHGTSGSGGLTSNCAPSSSSTTGQAPTTPTFVFYGGVTGGSAPQIVMIQAVRWATRFFWPILSGSIVFMLFFILSRNDFRIISVLKHKALRKRLSGGNNNNNKRNSNKRGRNNNRYAPSGNDEDDDDQQQQGGFAVTFDENGNVVRQQGYETNDIDETTTQSTMLNPDTDTEDDASSSVVDAEHHHHRQRQQGNGEYHHQNHRRQRSSSSSSASSSSSSSSSNGRRRKNSNKKRKSNDFSSDDEDFFDNSASNANNSNANDDSSDTRSNISAEAAASQAFVARMKTTFLVCACLCLNVAIAAAVGIATASIHASFFTHGCKSTLPPTGQTASEVFYGESLSFAKQEGETIARLPVQVFRATFFPGVVLLLLLLELADFWSYIMLPFQNRQVDVDKLLNVMEQYARAKADLERGITSALSSPRGPNIIGHHHHNNNSSSTNSGSHEVNAFGYQHYMQYSTQNPTTVVPQRITQNNNNINNTHQQHNRSRSNSFGNNSSIGGQSNSRNNNNNSSNQQGGGQQGSPVNKSPRLFFSIGGLSTHSTNNNMMLHTSTNNNSTTNIAGRAAAVDACGANSMALIGQYFSYAFTTSALIFWIYCALLEASGKQEESSMVLEFWLAVGATFLWKSCILNLLVHPAQRHWSLNLSLFASS